MKLIRDICFVLSLIFFQVKGHKFTLMKLKNALMHSYIAISINDKTDLAKEMFSWVLQRYKGLST